MSDTLEEMQRVMDRARDTMPVPLAVRLYMAPSIIARLKVNKDASNLNLYFTGIPVFTSYHPCADAFRHAVKVGRDVFYMKESGEGGVINGGLMKLKMDAALYPAWMPPARTPGKE